MAANNRPEWPPRMRADPLQSHVGSDPVLWSSNSGATPSYLVRFRDGREQVHGSGTPSFTLLVADKKQLARVLSADAYSAAVSFIRGEFDVEGDLIDAIRLHSEGRRRALRGFLFSAMARFSPRRVETWFQSRARAARNIRFHYDLSDEFYGQFLDSRMVYSCACFRDRSQSLEDAQREKLDHICRKLLLQPGERLLDIGCGWGGLLRYAAERYQVHATGCTLSANQTDYAAAAARHSGLADRVVVRNVDYREIRGRFDKIASVGMFEHVGRRRLEHYFRKIYGLLKDKGLFLNHGIVRPQFVKDDPQTLFLLRKVFPGGELSRLPDVIRLAERAGFEVLDVEALRPHYALTCREWVRRLRQNGTACVRLVGNETYRTWLLYLAGSALSFEEGFTDVHQLLLAKRSGRIRRLTRAHMYAGPRRQEASAAYQTRV